MRFLGVRLALLVPTLLGVLAVTFMLLYVAPGDPVQAMVGERADPETLARLRKELHLDEPLYRQFTAYVGRIVRGDLGVSYITRRSIVSELRHRFPATLRLALRGHVVRHHARADDRRLWRLATRHPGGPVPHTGGVPRRIVPGVLGRARPHPGVRGPASLAAAIRVLGIHLPDPSGNTLGMRSIAVIARMTRAALQEALQSDFIRTARAKGLGEGRVILRHGLRNALLPIITVLGLDFGSYLTGSILTETIFSWPGVGRYVLSAIEKRDLPAVQGSILFLSVLFVFVNLITDVLYAKADPRVAYD